MNMTHCLATQGWEWRASWGREGSRLVGWQLCQMFNRRLPGMFQDSLASPWPADPASFSPEP